MSINNSKNKEIWRCFIMDKIIMLCDKVLDSINKSNAILQEMKEKWDALHKKYCVEEQEELRCNN
jgi:hypothetical protein